MYEPKNLRKWTRPDHYFGASWPEYYSSGCRRSRDSDDLEESNFHCMLRELGGESETVLVIRESHWAVGWVEWIAIHESDSEALKTADEIQDALAGYPVIDEEDWSERETESANIIWRDCYDWQERIRYIRDHRYQFEFHDFADMLSCVRGNFFAGYASELIN